MQKTSTQNKGLPYRFTMLCISLVGASILIIFVLLLYKMDYISSVVAMWATVSIFFVAAIYESSLAFILVSQMVNKAPKKP